MSAQPKWQRARVLTAHGLYHPGDLLWVNGVPESAFLIGGVRHGERVVTYDTPDRSDRGLILTADQAFIELLPEFSFNDDPDAEVRQ